MAETDRAEASVLIVDDDADLREALVELVREAGFSVLGAPGGKEALEILRKSRPRLVLADLTMPDLDGVSFMDKALSMMEAAPVFVFITGALPSVTGDIGARLLRKPVDIDQLLHVVSEVCDS
jgi:CheY-like chemotaxis protein